MISADQSLRGKSDGGLFEITEFFYLKGYNNEKSYRRNRNDEHGRRPGICTNRTRSRTCSSTCTSCSSCSWRQRRRFRWPVGRSNGIDRCSDRSCCCSCFGQQQHHRSARSQVKTAWVHALRNVKNPRLRVFLCPHFSYRNCRAPSPPTGSAAAVHSVSHIDGRRASAQAGPIRKTCVVQV